MKKAAVLLTLLTFAIATSALADDDDRHQSYLSYDDGGTVVRSGEDGREVEAHRNLPIYPGDEVVTSRRGRAEVRLSDGNIIGIDRAASLLFLSMVDAYDGDSKETVIELKYGKIGVHRTDLGRDHVRLDTSNASYVAENEGVYTVETDPDGRDRVMVFAGTLEVRTPTRATRLREGESANVDGRGVYDLIGDQRTSADDFERWFLVRAERFGTYNSKYMDRQLSLLVGRSRRARPAGSFVTGIGWSWRPYVAVGWRPYYQRLLVQPRRSPDLGLVRSVGLGHVSLRPLGVRHGLRLGVGAGLRLLARRGCTGCTGRAMWAGRRRAGGIAIARTTTGRTTRTATMDIATATASTAGCAWGTSTSARGRSSTRAGSSSRPASTAPRCPRMPSSSASAAIATALRRWATVLRASRVRSGKIRRMRCAAAVWTAVTRVRSRARAVWVSRT